MPLRRPDLRHIAEIERDVSDAQRRYVALNAAPPGNSPRRWFDVQAAAGDRATVRIYGDIGESWWGDSVTASQFAEDLDALGPVGNIDLHINSPGGDAFDGITIMNTLVDHPATVTVYVDGLAASAASVIAMAGDKVIMGRGSQMMIHDAASLGFGNADELRKAATVLDSISGSMAAVYAGKTGDTTEAMRDAMRAETWYGAAEAVAAGLADEVSSKAEDDEQAAVAAMQHSRFAARFRYHGRAAAPAPANLAGTGRQAQPQNRSHDVKFTDAQLAQLRELGLPADQDAETFVAAIAEALQESDPPPAGTTAQLPAGVVAIDAEQLAALQADAAAGREARAEQVTARRAAKVEAAVRAGKIPPARREAWLANLAADEDGFTTVLDGLQAVIPTTELGHDDGSQDKAEIVSLEAVRGSDAYKNWKV